MNRLFASEEKVMEILWENGAITAKQVSLIAADKIGWNKNTTYTVLKKLVAKGYVRRDEPDFLCTPLLLKDEREKTEVKSLIENVFGGSKKALFSALLEGETLTEKEIAELKEMINKR